MKWTVIVLLLLSFKLDAQELKELDTIQLSSSEKKIQCMPSILNILHSLFVNRIKL